MTQKISFIRTILNLTSCLYLAALLACGGDDSSDQSETASVTQNKPFCTHHARRTIQAANQYHQKIR